MLFRSPWQPIGTMRTKALSPGRHTIRYSVSESSYCAINGTSMHGFIVPK